MRACIVCAAATCALGFGVASVLQFGGAAPLPRRHVTDWPMFGRDGTRNAVSPEKDPPTSWYVEGKRRTNIKWEADLGNGANCSSPVVAGGLVWIGTNNARPRDDRFKEDAAVLMCFRESDGKFLWQYVSHRLPGNVEDFDRASLNCSPLAEGDRLYFTTNRAEVVCLDIRPLRDGTGEPRRLWTLDMRQRFGVFPTAGSCMGIGFRCSIGVSYRERLYVSTGNGVGEDNRTAPFPEAPSLLCLNRDTGEVHWSDNSPGKDILYSQWSSPLVVEVRGRAQVIAAQGDGWVRSFDAMTGALLWKFDTNPKAAVWKLGGRGTRNYLPATPVYHDGRVYIGTGRAEMDGSGVGHLWCIDPARTPTNKDRDLSPVGDNFDARADINKNSGLVWHYGGEFDKKQENGRDFVFARTMSNVAVWDGLLIAPDASGYVHCLDARTGEPYWVHDAKDEIIGLPLIVDGKVYVPTTSGTTVVLALAREKKVLAENEIPDAIRASPVFANGVLYLASDAKLYAIRAAGR
jgi:outer membrane protein assembly factor BamB